MRFRPEAFFDDQFRLHRGVEIRNLVERHNIRFKAINHGASLNAGTSMSLTNSALCPVLTFQSAAKDVFSARSRKGV